MSSSYTIGSISGYSNGTFTGVDYTSELGRIATALESIATTQTSILSTLNTISGTLTSMEGTLNTIEGTLSKLEGDVSVISGLAAGDGIHQRGPAEWAGGGATFTTVANTSTVVTTNSQGQKETKSTSYVTMRNVSE